jgi:hypothetical protein
MWPETESNSRHGAHAQKQEVNELNPYSYVGNNPVIFSDPYGLARGCEQSWIDCYLKCMHDEAFSKTKNYWERLQSLVRAISQQQKPNSNPTIQINIQVANESLKTDDPAFVPTQTFMDVLDAAGELSIHSPKSFGVVYGEAKSFPKNSGQKRGYHVTRAWVEEIENRYLG